MKEKKKKKKGERAITDKHIQMQLRYELCLVV